MKVAINTCYGGFKLSLVAMKLIAKAKDWKLCDVVSIYYFETEDGERIFDDSPSFRSDSKVIDVIELLVDLANGPDSNIKIIEIPDDVKFQIGDNNGIEWVFEVHRTWTWND